MPIKKGKQQKSSKLQSVEEMKEYKEQEEPLPTPGNGDQYSIEYYDPGIALRGRSREKLPMS